MVGSLAFGQEDVPYDMLGIWLNTDGEALKISRQDGKITFTRRTAKEILAVGFIEDVEGELRVIRGDKQDEYSLGYFVGKETMVISKPREPQRAWLWIKIQ